MVTRKPAAAVRRRRKRHRTPKWLLEARDLDLIAQRRCLMMLSVLSGEKSVDEVCQEAGIVPALYYQLEKKAVAAMLAALVPGASSDGSPTPALKQLENRILELEAAKRRLERLLFLTRMTVKPGPLTRSQRGRTRAVPSSEPAGPKRLRVSTKAPKTTTAQASPSTRTQDGADEP